jgi:hypothetical protein
LGQESTWAAQAAECAADQGKFWEYHDTLFSIRSPLAFTTARLKQYAADLGLDKIMIYRLDVEKGTISVYEPQAARGPIGWPSRLQLVVGGLELSRVCSVSMMDLLSLRVYR